MRAIDTNLLVRLLTRDNEEQVARAEAFVSKGAWIQHVVLAEATWVLETVYELGAISIAQAIEMILNHEHLTVQDAAVVATALAQYRRKPSMGFSACLVLEVARKIGYLPLGTFDRRLGKMDGAQLL